MTFDKGYLTSVGIESHHESTYIMLRALIDKQLKKKKKINKIKKMKEILK